MTKRVLCAVVSAVLLSVTTPSAQTAVSKTGAPYDLQFIDLMHHHHADGIEMAKHEESHGQIAEVKTLAAKIRGGQEKDMPILMTIRKRLFGDRSMLTNASVAGMSMRTMKAAAQADMKKLMAANPTDPVFVELMIKHHQGAIKMSQEAVKRAADPELKKLAQQMLDVQTKEVAELQRHRGHGASPGTMDKGKIDHGNMDHGKK